MGKTWKDKPGKFKLKHRSPVPPPSQIHDDKRRKTRAQERIDIRRESDYDTFTEKE